MAKKQQARKSATQKSSARNSSAARAKAVAPNGKTSKSLKAAKGTPYVYLFGKKTDGNGTMKPLLGGKGANLAEMCRIGLPVPPGFTITTEVCTYYYDNKRTYPPALRSQMEAGIASIEAETGKKFGDRRTTRGSPGTAIAASCRCTATSSLACRRHRMRTTSRSRR
jgi:pyruvate,orthophosphate dikinase